MASIPPLRCSRHNLAAAPDGQCVLCRREASAVVVPAAAEQSSSAAGWLLALVVVVGGFGAWWLVGTRKSEPPPIAARPPVVVAAAKVETAEEAKPVEDDLTKSLRMLEQAEVERRALEHSIAQREQEERAAASARRTLEEKERDAKRHEAVKRDLASVGLASARRNVNITMYSTSWCGVCKQARAYMQQQQISFTELDIENDASARARQRALNPRGSVPVIAVDDEVLIGFSASSLENRIDRAARRRTGS